MTRLWQRRMLVFGLTFSASCSERLMDNEVEDSFYVCAPVIAYIELPGEEAFRLDDSQTGRSWYAMCRCTTEEQFVDEAYRSMVNELAYEACIEFVEREGYDPAHSDCLQSYEEQSWAASFGVPDQDLDEQPRECGAPIEPGCGVE